jgi:hypothetical protein
MLTFLRFLGLVVLLNVIRYVVGGLVEGPFIMPALFGVMEDNPSYFNTDFQTIDWITSFGYNFAMWAVAVWLYHLCRPVLSGSEVVRSLKVFGIAFLFFASVSFIYMNHYSHTKMFYVLNVADALLMFALVGLANGFLYPVLMRPNTSAGDGG